MQFLLLASLTFQSCNFCFSLPLPLNHAIFASRFSLPLSLNHKISAFRFPYLSIINFCSLPLSLNLAISSTFFPYLSTIQFLLLSSHISGSYNFCTPLPISFYRAISPSLFPCVSIIQFLHPSSHIFLSCNLLPLSMSLNHTISPSVSPFSPLEFSFLLIFSSSLLLPYSSVSIGFPFLFPFF
jgi:hypothetical protein